MKVPGISKLVSHSHHQAEFSLWDAKCRAPELT
jgi:hypothetical protein